MARLSLQEHVQKRAEKAGGIRALARKTGLDPSYLSRLASGHVDNPSEEVLRLLKLRRLVVYESARSVSQPEKEQS